MFTSWMVLGTINIKLYFLIDIMQEFDIIYYLSRVLQFFENIYTMIFSYQWLKYGLSTLWISVLNYSSHENVLTSLILPSKILLEIWGKIFLVRYRSRYGVLCELLDLVTLNFKVMIRLVIKKSFCVKSACLYYLYVEST